MEIYSEEQLINALQDQSVIKIYICYTTQSFPLLDDAKHLQKLWVSNNKLKALPSLDNLTSLQDLWVYNNELKALPESISIISYKDTYSDKYPKWLNYKILTID